ncbi:MAG: hypothetical protein RIF34_04420, partial [Candidatus Kapaibacterium sp.]
MDLNIDWTVDFSFSEIAIYLSDFGKSLIQGEGIIANSIFTTSRTKYLKGLIDGKYPITMLLNLSYNDRMKSYDIDESFYWYDKVGIGHYLMGSADSEGHYWLNVFDLDTRTSKESFSFIFDG